MVRTFLRPLAIALTLFLFGCPDEALEIEDAQFGGSADAALDASINSSADAADAGESIDDDAGTSETDAGFDPSCTGCRADGEECEIDLNCRIGSVCTDGICVRVLCEDDDDCAAPAECSLEGICRPPVCQGDEDCMAPEVCRAGECSDPPLAADALDCSVLTDGLTMLTGERRPLHAITRTLNQSPLVGLALEWTSSDERVVDIQGEDAVGGVLAGSAILTARVANNPGVICHGQVIIANLTPRLAGTTRVALVANDTGVPVPLIDVFLETSSTATAAPQIRVAATSTLGEVVFPGETPVRSVTVVHPDYDATAVLEPGGLDLMIVLRRRHPRSEHGGIRGFIDTSQLPGSDLRQGLAGTALRPGLADFGLTTMLCNTIDTEVHAPQLGIEELIQMPGGSVASAGDLMLTDDFAGARSRCTDAASASDQLGCFAVPSERGIDSPWAIAGSFSIAEISPFVNMATEPSFFCGGASPLPVGFPWLFRTMYHGVKVRVDVQEALKVNRPNMVGKCENPNLPNYDSICAPDYSQFLRTDIPVVAPMSIMSRVRVPALPNRPSGEGCFDSTLVIAGVTLPERGLLPLGFAAGVDADSGELDCNAGSIVPPFGSNTAPLAKSVLPLWMAPRHSGLEVEPTLTLAAVAFSARDPADPRLSMSARFARMNSIGDDVVISGDYLPLPVVDLDLSEGVMRVVDPSPQRATYRRIELTRPEVTSIIFVPAGLEEARLPNIPGLRAALGLDTRAVIEIGEIDASYDRLFAFGQGHTLDRWIEQLEAVSVEECRELGSGCILRR
jgi:hypothetical protein